MTLKLRRQGTIRKAVVDQQGFTIVELMVSMAVMTIIIGGIATAIVTSFSNSNGIFGRLSDSHDSQVTASYFVRDVQNSVGITKYSGQTLCGTGSQVLGLQWRTAGTNFAVSYVRTNPTPSSYTLVRNLCQNGAQAPQATLAHDLNSTAMPSVGFVCASSTDTTCQSDAGSGVVVGRVATVQLTVIEAPVNGRPPFQYSVTASPRYGSLLGSQTGPPPGTPGNSLSVLLLNPPGSPNPVLNCSGSGGPVTVNGLVGVNSAASGSMYFAGKENLVAQQVYSGSPSPVSGNPYTSTSAQPYTPPPNPNLPDPYANLPDPSTAGLQTYSTGNSLPGPGVYTSNVDIASSGKKLSLLPGVYIFENGFTLSGSNNIISGTGVTFFIGFPNDNQLQSAQFLDAGGTNVLNITPPSVPSLYAGISIFQARTDTALLTVEGSGSAIGGVIYAPNATVNTSGGGTSTIGSVIAGSLTCGGGGTFTIGPSSPVVPTTTSMSSAPNPSVVGQFVTFTSTVASASTGDPAPNEGSVTFSANGRSLCTAPVNNGSASCTGAFRTSGSSSVTANYSGGITYKASNSPGSTQVVNAASTTTTLSSSANPSQPGQQITYTATVTVNGPGSGPPPNTDAVIFKDGVSPVNCAGGSQSFNGTTATCVVTYTLTAGSPHSITAVFSGDSNFSGSTSQVWNQSVVGPTLTMTANGNKKLHIETFSGTTTENNGTVSITVYLGNTASGVPVMTYTVTVFTGGPSTYNWSTTTAPGDLINGQTYTAQATQVDKYGNPNASPPPQVTFTAA